MKILKEVLRKNLAVLLVFIVITAINLVVFKLYGLFMEPLIYAALVGLFFVLILILYDYLKEKRRSLERVHMLNAILSEWRELPKARTLAEGDYQKMIARLGACMEQLTRQAETERQDMVDYYTTWVHQIKTPIAVMRLKLAEDTPEHRALSVELARIEQYAEMALQYIRIGSATNDLVIREYNLDDLIREVVRKLAPQFVEKRLKLVFVPTGESIVTDKKWFSCILEQLLSNAVKYTPSGEVKIQIEDHRLTISDTGIGIAPEDLPRIFEKGFTGINGRMDQKSSGLGLYLAKKAADLLSIPLSCESTVGKGSIFTLDLQQPSY